MGWFTRGAEMRSTSDYLDAEQAGILKKREDWTFGSDGDKMAKLLLQRREHMEEGGR